MNSKVFIVGAGIGGVEFLTVRARDLISEAEVIISDALVDRTLLDLAPAKLRSPHCWQTWRTGERQTSRNQSNAGGILLAR